MLTILFIHGFSAKKEDNEYFINYIKNKKGIKIYDFVLPGHEDDKMSYVSYEKWLERAEKEFLKINNNNLILVGHSMGAVIATHLAIKYRVYKLILLSPAYIFGSFGQNVKDVIEIRKNLKLKLETGFEGIFQKAVEVPIKSMFEYKKLVHISKNDLGKVSCPVLVMHGDKDNIISIKSSKYVMESLKTRKTFVVIENVRHQIFKSHKKEEISKYIYNYIRGGLIYIFNKKSKL